MFKEKTVNIICMIILLAGIISITAPKLSSAAEINSNDLILEQSGSPPLNPSDISECLASWDCSSAEWSEECIDGLQSMISDPGEICQWTGESPEEACYFLKPSSVRGCFQSSAFPFFDWWNAAAVLMLLAGFYIRKMSKKGFSF